MNEVIASIYNNPEDWVVRPHTCLILIVAAYMVACALETARIEREAREHWQAQYGHAVAALKEVERQLEKRL